MEGRNASTSIRGAIVALVATGVMAAGCTLTERCYENRDCPSPKLCNTTTGACYHECEEEADCEGVGFHCVDHTCQFSCDGGEIVCPEDMVEICGSFCIDRYEASRPDATSTAEGTDESRATSRAGVIPWFSGELSPQEAAGACTAAGKRLCSAPEWEVVCAGLDGHEYCYGESYDPLVCNAIDTHCDPECGIYPDCYWDCDSDFQVLPTGAMTDCVSEFGVHDLSGNVWEAVDVADGAEHFRGGAFDCGDPALAHSCAYDGVVAGSFPTVRGFRCCAAGEPAG